MEFGYSDLQQTLQDSLSNYLSTNSPLDRVRKFADSDDSFDKELWQGVCSELSIQGLLISEEYGGQGLESLDAVAIAETIGKHVAPIPFFSSCIVAPRAIERAALEPQKQDYLPRLAAGEITIGLALSELSGARANAGLTVGKNGINGTAYFVLDPDADYLLLADQKSSLHVVQSNADGISKKPMPQIDRTRRLAAVTFENVPSEHLPGCTGSIVRELLDLGRVCLAAETLGASQEMMDRAVEYSLQREQFNRPVASFQAVKHLCAEMAAELEPARSLLLYGGYALDALPEEAHLAASHTSAHLAEVGTFVAKTATIVHGGMGFTDLLGLHYWFKRIGFNRQYLGSPELLREEAARTQGLIA